MLRQVQPSRHAMFFQDGSAAADFGLKCVQHDPQDFQALPKFPAYLE